MIFPASKRENSGSGDPESALAVFENYCHIVSGQYVFRCIVGDNSAFVELEEAVV